MPWPKALTGLTEPRVNSLATSTSQLTSYVHEFQVITEGEKRLVEMLVEVALDRAGDGLGVQLKLITEVNLVQLAFLHTILEEFAGLGEDARLAI